MKKSEEILLDFEIDKLTNSIENNQTGETFTTDVIRVSSIDKSFKKSEWQFDWSNEVKKTDRQIYKLVTTQNKSVIHGLISISDNEDHIFMNLIESSKVNKGKHKVYNGVSGNLVAFACKTAFEKGYSGVVAFVAKTHLIEHYQNSLGAKILVSNKLYIDTREALNIVKKYFKSFEQ